VNYLDIFIAAALVWGAWKGFKKGFIYELFMFLALFIGLYAGIHFTDFIVERFVSEEDLDSSYAPLVVFSLIFLAVGAMVYFAGKTLEKMIKVVRLSLINKLLGLFFGVLKFAFFCGALILLIEGYDDRKNIISEETKNGSLLYNGVHLTVLYAIPAFGESSLFLKDVLLEEEEIEETDVEI
jgi:membrane protein required for colicin V production